MDVREKLSNEKRLIDANELLKNGLRAGYGFDNDGVLLIPMGDVIRSIKKEPTIDAVPVVHGRWRLYPDCGVTRCSVCDWSIEECIDYKYCPNCGARMDGGAD